MADDDSPERMPAEEPDDRRTVRGLAVGERVFGRYVLESILGQGGMGVVWRARDDELGNTVALKFLPEVVARDDAAVDDLKEETRNALRLTHPNIVRIHHFERDGNTAAVSMEYVDGATLSRLRLAQPGKVFSAEMLAPLVAQLCAALSYAHGEAKLVHRDLKPANLLLTHEGRLKIADFGIARSLADTHTRLTGRTVGTSGTLLFMSPQQLLGEKARVADDIYALGATLYELLTGRPPFFTGDIATQVQNVTPPPLAERRSELGIAGAPIPAAWEKTIAACLAKDPAQRPQNAGEVATRLGLTEARPAVKGSFIVGERSAVTGAGSTKPRISPRVLLVAGLAVIALGLLAYSFWPKTGPPPAFDPSKPFRVIFEPPLADLVTVFDETKAKAERGDADAQAELGAMYVKGLGVPQDSAEALRWFRKAADQGNARGQNGLGVMYANGWGVAKDSTVAVRWYRKAADQGFAYAQYYLGVLYANGDGVPKDSAKAVELFRKAADQGNADAWWTLGRMYIKGDGVPKDSAEAVKWYRKAADQGNADAQHLLGLLYIKGDGVPKDSAEAARWFLKAADQGDASAQRRLGLAYENGDGVPKDGAEAVRWLSKAADQGNANAQSILALMYLKGDGVAKDSTEAARLYRKAADQGNADAQCYLGVMYEIGEGVPKDEVEALAWYYLAVASGDSSSVTLRYSLERRLGTERTLSAQQRSKELLKEIEAAKSR